MDVPTFKATQAVISALQTCEKYTISSQNPVHANFISGYPRNLDDIEDYMERVRVFFDLPFSSDII